MEFKKLSEVQLVEGAVDTANVLIEENGEIKRVPKTQVGGTCFPTAIIESSDYTSTIASYHRGAQAADLTDVTYECLNMTFEEAYNTLLNGEVLDVICKVCFDDTPAVFHAGVYFGGTEAGVESLMVFFDFEGCVMYLYWTSDGISEQYPGKPV